MKLRERFIFLLSIFQFLLSRPAWGSFGELDFGAKALALGGAYVGMAEGPSTIFFNPAGLGEIKTLELEMGYRKPYSLSQLNHVSLAVSQPRFGGGLCLGIIRKTLGTIYSEEAYSLGWGISYMIFALGGNMRILSSTAPGRNSLDYKGRCTKFTFDYGLLFRPFFNLFSLPALVPLTLGYAHLGVREPKMSLLKDGEGERVKSIRRAGLCYSMPTNVNWLLELKSEEGEFKSLYKNLHSGVEVWFDHAYAVRLGIDRGRFTGGIGIEARALSFAVALLTHRELGNTYGIALSYRPKGVSY